MIAQARHLGLLDRLPALLVVAGAAVGIAGWVLLYRLGRRYAAAGLAGVLHNVRTLGLIVLRVVLGFAGVWMAFHALGWALLLATSWPLWLLAAAAALLAEALVWLYELERRIVSRRMGLVLTGLRLGLLGLLVLMLVQPAWVSVSTHVHKRTVAVLVDTSASMHIADRQLRPHQRLRLAEALSVLPAQRPYRLEEQARSLRRAREAVLDELEWLDALAGIKPQRLRERLGQRRRDLNEALSQIRKDVLEQIKPVDSVLGEARTLPQQWRAALLDAKATLGKNVIARLQQACDLTGSDQAERLAENFDRLRDGLRRAAAAVGKAAPTIDRAGQELDAMLYGQLGGEDRSAVDAVSRLTRLELAKAVLLRRPTAPGSDRQSDSLLQRLQSNYHVKVYTFNGAFAEADVEAWQAPPAGAAAQAHTAPATAAAPGKDPQFTPAQLQTDLAGAMSKALAEASGQDLAGFIVLSDGQDNAKGRLQPLARHLGALGASFSAAVTGADTPPTDAAIIAVESPDTIYKDDRMYVNADVKLDGLNAATASVVLYDGDRVVDLRNVQVTGDVFRTRVQLADEPKKAGLHAYRLEVKPKGPPGAKAVEEVFAENNSCALTLSVTDDRTKVLLVDARPRWEFRYLKNLFTGRDKTVRLQYVLTHPDRFYGQPAPAKPVWASVSRPAGQEEATALPESEAEWMKFDVVILGDVPAADLAGGPGPAKDPAAARLAAEAADKVMRIVRKFVADRGGTLVLIAGPDAMPGAFAGTALAELIPVELPRDPAAARQASRFIPPKEGFRVAITDEGAEHVICRQDVEPKKSRAAWRSLPPVFWRSAHTQATGGATVLAYALDAKAPKWLTGTPAAATSPEALAKRRREHWRRHALVAVAPHGLGKVLMLNFDRTWRLRYRVGDRRHHKFWGQVLRWATAGKLPAGTHLVKLGADKTRYRPADRPVVRAKIVRDDFSPVVTEQAAVRIICEGQCIGRAPMKYLKDSPGLYSATLDELRPGSYRLELDCPEAEKLLKEGEPKLIATEISVDPAAAAEQVELAANRHLLERLAGLSHNGVVVPAWRAGDILRSLPTGRVTRPDRREFRLWDSWLLLALFCLAATAEWVLRKRAGLT